MQKSNALSRRLSRVLGLLRKTQPDLKNTDVAWWGPPFVTKRGDWFPTYFSIYQGTLYCNLAVPPQGYDLAWRIGGNEMDFNRGFSGGNHDNGESLWTQALGQVESGLRRALRDSSLYNRYMEKNFPLRTRTGKIERGFTWTQEAPLPFAVIQKLKEAILQGATPARFSGMTVDRYLRAAGVAYDAAFKELRSLSPLDKYKKRADPRHGGMLDLPRRDAVAFAQWYDGKTWSGTHPWEIVYGHPHGILLSPEHRKEENSWGFSLGVDSLAYYASAARMAIALAAAKLPFEFHRSEEVIKALLGTDDVEVGPGLYEVHFQDLKRSRPDALSQIRWDPLHPIMPIFPDQRARVKGQTVEPFVIK